MPEVQPVPQGFHTVTPYLVVRDAAAAIDFYTRAFDAEELYRCACEESRRVMNAKLRIGSSMLMLNDEFPEHGSLGPVDGQPSPVTIHLYLDDVDAVFEQAVAAGATVTMPPAMTFWGDRFAAVEDPFGHKWSLATHKEDLSDEEIRERAKRAFS